MKGTSTVRRLTSGALALALAQAPALAGHGTPAEKAWDQRRLQGNGIDVGQPRVHDNGLLQQMLNDAQARLGSLQLLDQAALLTRLGTVSGADQRTSALALSAQMTPLPSIATTDKGATGTTTRTVTDTVSAEGKKSSSDVQGTTAGQATTDTVTTAPQVSPPPAAATLPAGAFPSTFGVSSSDVLNEQMQLTSEIANLRLLLDGALSDHLFASADLKRAKPRITIGFPITIQADERYQDAVAVVEVEIECRHSLDPDDSPAVTAVVPRDKTYNVAAITDSTRSFGLGIATRIVGFSGSWISGHKTYYLTQDQDTLGLTFQPERERVAGVAWEFRPVLGRRFVRAGQKQVFAQLALPVASDERIFAHVRVRTYWRKYDRKKAVLKGIVPGSLREDVVRTDVRRFPLEVPPTDFTAASLEDLGGGQMLVRLGGRFLSGSYVRIGTAFIRPGSPNASFEPSGIRFVAPIVDLATRQVVLVARDGTEIPLVIPKLGDGDPPQPVTVPEVSEASLRTLDETRSVLSVRFKQALDDLKPPPILVAGGRVYGYSDAPLERERASLRAIVPTAALVANPTVLVSSLFAASRYGRTATVAAVSPLSQSERLVVLESGKGATRFLLYGSRLADATVLVPAGVTLQAIGGPGDADTLKLVSLTAEQVKGHRQLVLQRKGERPSFVAVPALDSKEAKASPPPAR